MKKKKKREEEAKEERKQRNIRARGGGVTSLFKDPTEKTVLARDGTKALKKKKKKKHLRDGKSIVIKDPVNDTRQQDQETERDSTEPPTAQWPVALTPHSLKVQLQGCHKVQQNGLTTDKRSIFQTDVEQDNIQFEKCRFFSLFLSPGSYQFEKCRLFFLSC